MLSTFCGKFVVGTFSRNDTEYVTGVLWLVTNISRSDSFQGITSEVLV